MCARNVSSWSNRHGVDYYADMKIIGVGGGGCKAIEHMISDRDRVKRPVGMATFIAIDTDAETLDRSGAAKTLLLGNDLIYGRGCNGDPTQGRKAADADREALKKLLSDTDVVFIVASLGGGTGSGSAPVLAEVARELNIHTVAVVTLPCSFEGAQRDNYATVGEIKLYQQVPTIVIPNDQFLGDGVTPLGAFAAANDRQLEAIRALAEMINPDCTHFCTDVCEAFSVMNMGAPSKIGIGFSSEDNRAEKAARKAIADLKLCAQHGNYELNGIIFNIAAGVNFSLDEFDLICNSFKSILPKDTLLIPGQFIDPLMEEGIRVTAIASYSDPAEAFWRQAETKNNCKAIDAANNPDELGQ